MFLGTADCSDRETCRVRLPLLLSWTGASVWDLQSDLSVWHTPCCCSGPQPCQGIGNISGTDAHDVLLLLQEILYCGLRLRLSPRRLPWTDKTENLRSANAVWRISCVASVLQEMLSGVPAPHHSRGLTRNSAFKDLTRSLVLPLLRIGKIE